MRLFRQSLCLRSLSFLFVLLLTAGSLWGGSLSGEITDAVDGIKLPGTTITIKAVGSSKILKGVAANHEGSFELKDIPAGEYIVSATLIGYAVEVMNKVVISDGETANLNIDLSPSALNMHGVSVTASRRPEKILEAPASVSVIQSEEIAERTTLSPTEHLKGIPAVDVATTGLNQSNVVVRGFNNIFSGALLVLTDNRIARVPSLRFNAYNFIPTINEDIEQIEIVSGPGSALYGPNSASGVMHIITKSPFSSQGTTFSFGAGERDLYIGSFRHAGLLGSKVGFKLSGQYYEGSDWKSTQPSEPDMIQLYEPTSNGPNFIGDSIINQRDFNIKRLAGEGRIDFLIGDNSSLILNAGVNQASSIELTGLGAAQVIDWTYSFGQARFRTGDLFIQGFVNASNAGDTYLLNTGQMIVDNSRLWGAQIQHRYSADENFAITYGFDGLFTRPNTKSTVNGLNEDDDNIDELGVYLQADLKLMEKLKLVGAARFDDNSRLDEVVFSPRAGLVYMPAEGHNFRATYNRAFSTPDNNNLYLDILQTLDFGNVGASFLPSLGFAPAADVRVQGVPESGFHWRMGDEGPMFRSAFAPVAGLTTEDFIDFNDPAFTNVMWSLGRGATIGAVTGGDSNHPLYGPLNAVAPSDAPGVMNTLMTLNPDTESMEPSNLNDIADIDRMRPTITNTLELGYKGMITDRLRFTVDLYRTQKDDFIGPLTVETPNVFLDPATLQAYLSSAIFTNYGTASSADSATLMALDGAAMGGNGNGSPVDEMVAMFTRGAAGIPFGTVTPEEAYDPTAILVTYRNFGDISFYGTDLSFAYQINHTWNIGGMYSYVSKNFFEKNDNQVHDINLNAPRHKFGLHLNYLNRDWGTNAQMRFRFIDAFDMDSPFFGSSVRSYRVMDLNVGQKFIHGTRLALSVQNILDEKHIEFVGGPAIGRLAILRLTKSFN